MTIATIHRLLAKQREALTQRYPRGDIPASNCRQLYADLVALVTYAIAEANVPPSEKATLLATLAERFEALPKPWH